MPSPRELHVVCSSSIASPAIITPGCSERTPLTIEWSFCILTSAPRSQVGIIYHSRLPGDAEMSRCLAVGAPLQAVIGLYPSGRAPSG